MRMELDESGRCPPSYSQAVHRLPPATVQRTVSGSETDVSTSTENLTREEKYVLNHTERQEPQGEENFVTPSPVSSLSLSTPPAVMEWAKSVDGFKCPAPVSSRPLSGRPPPKYQLPAAAAASVSAAAAGGDSAAAAAAGGVLYQRRPALLHTPELALASRPATSVSMVPGALSQSLIMTQSSAAAAAAAPSPAVAAAAAASVTTPSAAHLSGASMAPPPPPPAAMVISGGGGGQPAVDPAAGAGGVECRLTPNVTEMIQLLIQENSGLKQHLAAYQRKVQKMQQFAEELSQLQAAYDDLVLTCQRREQLEGLARQRLAAEARRANQLNTSLSCQLADTSTAAGVAPTAAAGAATSCSGSCESERRQLAALNRELLSTKERQEIELAAQRSTLQEQRQYIDILDTALTKAQENTALIERQHAERIRCQYVERSTYVERVAQLQRQLTASQLAAERRETAHRKIRAQLERELAELRCSRRDTLLLLQESSGDGAGGGGGGEEVHARETELASLRQQLRTAHERILLMENELAHAHQKFVDGGESEADSLLLNASVAHRSIVSPPPPPPPSTTAAAAALSRSTALASEAYCAQLVDHSATQMAPAVEATSSSTSYCRSQFSQSAAAPPTVQQQQQHQQQQYLSAVCQPLSLADQRDQSIEHRMMSLEVQLAEKEALVRELQQRRHRTTLRTPASVAAAGGAGGGAGGVAPQLQPPPQSQPHSRQSSAQSLPATASYATSSAVLSDMLAPSCSSLIHSSHRGAGGRSLLDETMAHDYASVTPSVLSTLSAELDRLSTNQRRSPSSLANQRRSPSSLANQRPPASAATNPGTPAASALANRTALSSMAANHQLATSAAANQSAAQPAAYGNTCHILPPYLSAADRLTASPHSQHQQPYDSGRADFPPLTSANHSAVLSALANQSAAHAASTNHNPPYNVSASHSAADTYSTNHNPPVYSGSTNQSAVYASSTNHNHPFSVSANQTLSPLVTSSSPPPHPSTANSILLALQKDTEVFPDHYWQV